MEWFWWGTLYGNGIGRLQNEREQVGHVTRAKPALVCHPLYINVMREWYKEMILQAI